MFKFLQMRPARSAYSLEPENQRDRAQTWSGSPTQQMKENGLDMNMHSPISSTVHDEYYSDQSNFDNPSVDVLRSRRASTPTGDRQKTIKARKDRKRGHKSLSSDESNSYSPTISEYVDGTTTLLGRRCKRRKRGRRSQLMDPLLLGSLAAGDEIVTLNVSGERFQTFRSTLERYPNSRLGDPQRIEKHWDDDKKEYFFDRRRNLFESILYIYQSPGRIIRPSRTPLDHFVEEIEYFDMGQEVMEEFWESEGFERPKPRPPHPGRWKWQGIVWDLMEHADTSTLARCIAMFSVFVIVLSITNFCLETIKELKEMLTPAADDLWPNPFHAMEAFCIVYFTVEFTLRIISCPNLKDFLKSFLNIIDLVSILPFYLNLAVSGASGGAQFAMLRVLRLIRVFRIFKLSRHSVGLQILGKTFAASMQEFALLIFFLCIALVLFSSGMYFAEQGQEDRKTGQPTNFESIPAAFWYSLVTMTTIGYGDMVPQGVVGKLIGSMCALFGVLTLAMPVPIIVANFKHFYEQEQRLQQLRHSNQPNPFQVPANPGDSA